jgi:Fic family protein
MLGLDPSEYNSREISMLYKLSSGIFYGKLTADKYTKMMKCTSATSTRDLTHLTSKGMLVKSGKEEGQHGIVSILRLKYHHNCDC